MTIRPFVAGNYFANQVAPRLMQQKGALDELQRQLATGQRAETYGGLGVNRVTALDIRQKLALIDGYQGVALDAGQRVRFMDLSLDRLNKSSAEFRSVIGPSSFTRDLSGQPVAVTTAKTRLDEMIDLLNAEYGGRSLFAGRASDVRPMASSQTMLDGDATGDGLRTLIEERRLADAGTGTGRTLITGAGAAARLAEEAPGLPFGLKFDAGYPAVSTLSNATVTGPAGAPAALDVTFAGNPQDGETLSFRFVLPGGATRDVTLTARSALGVGATADAFSIGATPAATAANLRAALTALAQRETDGALRGASALEVAKDFFAQRPGFPPDRVLPPFATATAFAAPGARPTVAFYTGEDTPAASPTPTAPGVIRTEAPSRIEQGVTVGLGVRGNEPGFQAMLASLAAFVATDFTEPAGATEAQKTMIRDRFQSMAEGARGLLANGLDGQTVARIQTEISTVSVSIKAATERLRQRENLLTGLQTQIEGVDKEEIAAKVLTLQTSLQASYQVTSIVSQLSLVNALR
jgi:flagellin-like hook-associated protein FlgL